MLRPLVTASGVFFASGAAALCFETLWFRRAGLALGNGVWASALVLSSFMAGLAIGNALAARRAATLTSPIRTYALLELVIAASGLALVVVLPALAPLLAPWLAPLAGSGPWLEAVRFGLSFVLLLIPSVAMGATLPILVHALRSQDADFGRLLGRLYGWNTLGAMAGAVATELWWIPAGGIYGAAAVAVLLNAIAACGAFVLLGRARDGSAQLAANGNEAPESAPTTRSRAASARLLAAATLSGGCALAFEVVWFRILVQFMPNSSATFAYMLAVVLGGIAVGSLVAVFLFRFFPQIHGYASVLAIAACALAVNSFAIVPGTLTPFYDWIFEHEGPSGAALLLPAWNRAVLSLILMLPVSVASGVLYAWLAKRLEEALPDGEGRRSRAAGLIALANSLGAAVGPLIAGFVLLPQLGMEGATFVLAAGYLAVAALCFERREWLPTALVLLPSLWFLLAFPFGSLEATLRSLVRAQFGDQEEIIALREGVVETAIVTERRFEGAPLFRRLVTDGYSMSATTLPGLRYMRLYVNLPAAIHPGLERALLISFGVGTTADALTRLDELDTIDIVDISPEILELASVFRPGAGENPLDDPRVQVHIEDGRYFLQTTEQRYDLITSEPPPPAYAGVVNLYTAEYFELIRKRLRPGGFASYWLPISQMSGRASKAITRSFCLAFDDCTLWESYGGDWMLIGSKDAQQPVSEARAGAQWREPDVAASLIEIGFEGPEQLGAIFLGDRTQLEGWIGDSEALVDAHPERAPKALPLVDLDDYQWSSDYETRKARFATSTTIVRWWPPALRRGTLPHFALQNATRLALSEVQLPFDARLMQAHRALTQTSLEVVPLWFLDSSVRRQQIAAEAGLAAELGRGALARRRYAEAIEHFESAAPSDLEAKLLLAYALAVEERADEARPLLETLRQSPDAAIRRGAGFVSNVVLADTR